MYCDKLDELIEKIVLVTTVISLTIMGWAFSVQTDYTSLQTNCERIAVLDIGKQFSNVSKYGCMDHVGILTMVTQAVETSKDEVIQQASEVLKLHEGFRSNVYRCSSNQRTIGYGTAAKSGQQNISRQEAHKLLVRELEKNYTQLTESIPWWEDLSAGRQIALLNLTYNMGIDKLLQFKKMLRSLESGDYELASKQLLLGSGHNGKSKYYTQVGKRAEHVSSAIQSSSWDMQELRQLYA